MKDMRDLPVSHANLEEIGRLLHESRSGDCYAWFDTATGELIMTTSLYGVEGDGSDEPSRFEADGRALPDWMESERGQVQAIYADESGRYLTIPIGGENGGSGLLEAFARTLTDPVLRNGVRDAMHGRGAFRRVKDVLHRHGQIDLWHAFESARDLAAARRWLEDEGIRPVEEA
ncbi:MAG: hypothetical protein V4850_12020 [Myxococcota bacterium]